MKNHKAKGSKGERELVKLFNEAGWSCIRVAGSGSSRYPAPDILAANAIRRVAIECKVTKENKKYFQNQEIDQLQEFSHKFGSESWIGVKFPDQPWYFLMLEDLKDTGRCWLVSLEIAQMKGLKIDELLESSSLNRNL
ncbi:MAG: Holliday junction resolvase [Nanoarchaeota archaeon]|nr:Holliday junction resolvase [Nanoarchaeota archaeon]MBU1623266.1 Holliday junction resolvase [Nanoarchaeota archaeon]